MNPNQPINVRFNPLYKNYNGSHENHLVYAKTNVVNIEQVEGSKNIQNKENSVEIDNIVKKIKRFSISPPTKKRDSLSPNRSPRFIQPKTERSELSENIQEEDSIESDDRGKKTESLSISPPTNKKNSLSPKKSPRVLWEKIFRKEGGNEQLLSEIPISESNLSNTLDRSREHTSNTKKRLSKNAKFYFKPSESEKNDIMPLTSRGVEIEKKSVAQVIKQQLYRKSTSLSSCKKILHEVKVDNELRIEMDENALKHALLVAKFKESLVSDSDNSQSKQEFWKKVWHSFQPLVRNSSSDVNLTHLVSGTQDIWRIADKYKIKIVDKECINSVQHIQDIHPLAYEQERQGVLPHEYNERFLCLTKTFEKIVLCSEKSHFPELIQWKNYEDAGNWVKHSQLLQNPLLARFLYSCKQTRYTETIVSLLILQVYGGMVQPTPLLVAHVKPSYASFQRVFLSDGSHYEIIRLPVKITSRDDPFFIRKFTFVIHYDYDNECYLTRIRTKTSGKNNNIL